MKNKGFTLVELLGVIVLISLIAVIIIPTTSKMIKKGSDVADAQKVENIILAAKNWASDNKEILPKESDGTYGVKVIELQDEGYIDKDIDIPLINATPSMSEEEKKALEEKACVQIVNIKKNNSSKNIYDYTYESECDNSVPCQMVLNDKPVTSQSQWYNTPVTVNVKNGNGDPGYITTVADTDYDTIKDTAAQSITVDDDTGSKQVIYYGYVKDSKGKNRSCSVTFGIDKQKPNCTISGDLEGTEIPLVNGTITSSKNGIKLTGKCNDEGSGCVQSDSLTTGQYNTSQYQETFSNVQVKDSKGNSQVCDKAGNCTQCEAVNVVINKVMPTCTVTATSNPNGNGWYKGSVRLVINLYINGEKKTLNEINAEKYGIYASNTGKPDTKIDFKDVSSTGTYNGYVKIDGKEIDCTPKEVKIDTTAPSCSFIAKKCGDSCNINGKTNYTAGTWTNTNVITSANCSDAGGSGCDYKTVTSRGQDNDVTNSKQDTRQVNKQGGNVTITWTVYDKAGNYKACSAAAIKIDKTDPKCTISISGKKCGKIPAGKYYYKEPSMSTSDKGGSGIKTSSMSWKAYYRTNCTSLSTPRTGNGSAKFYCGAFNRKVVINGKVSDKAGNSNTCSKTFYTNYPGTC